jgi:hypothetical protein
MRSKGVKILKIKVTQVLKTYKGDDMNFIDTDGSSRPLTLRNAIDQIISRPPVDEAGKQLPMTGKEKARIFNLCNKIWNGKEADFTPDEITYIKERADKSSVAKPLIHGRLLEILFP